MDKKMLSQREVIRKNITELRNNHGLSMKAVAEAIGVSPNTYRVWEDEDENSGVKPYRIVQLAKIYGVSTDYILLEHDEEFELTNSKPLSVSSPNLYNKNIYKEKYLSELEDYEKLLVMKVRRLGKEDKKRLNEIIGEMLDEIDKYNE